MSLVYSTGQWSVVSVLLVSGVVNVSAYSSTAAFSVGLVLSLPNQALNPLETFRRNLLRRRGSCQLVADLSATRQTIQTCQDVATKCAKSRCNGILETGVMDFGLYLVARRRRWLEKGQNPLHQFPRSKSVITWCGQKSVVSVVSCRLPNSITTTCCQLVSRVANKSAAS